MDGKDAEEEKKEEGDASSDEDPTKGETRQKHHKPMKKGTTDHDVLKQYAILINRAATILVCNYASLTLGIGLGWAGR